MVGDERTLAERDDACQATFQVAATLHTLLSMRIQLPETVQVSVAALFLGGEEVVQHTWLGPTARALPFPSILLHAMSFTEVQVRLRLCLDFSLHDLAFPLACERLPSPLARLVQEFLHPRVQFFPYLHCEFASLHKMVLSSSFCRSFSQYGHAASSAPRHAERFRLVNRSNPGISPTLITLCLFSTTWERCAYASST